MDMPSAFNWAFDLHIPRYTGTSLSEFWFNFILMNVTFLLVYLLKNSYRTRKVSWFLLLIFCLYAFWDTDYFSFASNFYNGLEDFRDPLYKYISYLSFDSYIIFRFWIWGTALVLVYLTAKKFRLNTNIMCYVFTIFFMLTFSYARVSLGMALYFFGLSYIIVDKGSKVKNIPLVAVSFVLAYMSHRSMLLPIILTPFVFWKITKRKLILLLSLSPVVIVFIKFLLGSLITKLLVGNSGEFANSAQGYLSSEITMKFNWKWELITTLRYWSFYIATIYTIWYFYFRKKVQECPPEIKSLISITLSIETIAIAILIIGGNELLGLWVIGYRYLYMTGIPICIIITYMYQTKLLSDKALKFILLPSLLYAELFIFGKILTLQFL